MNQLVSTEWLEKNLNKVKVLDASWHLPNEERNAFEEYTGSYDKESKDVFPESLYRMYCVNCPWYVRFGWTMVKKAVPTKTSEKFRVWGTGFYADLCKVRYQYWSEQNQPET